MQIKQGSRRDAKPLHVCLCPCKDYGLFYRGYRGKGRVRPFQKRCD